MSQPECLYLPPSPPSSDKMDPTAADGSCENSSSPPVRSTAGSRVSVSRDRYIANLDIRASPQGIPAEVDQPLTSSPHNYPSSAYLSPPTAPSAYLPTSSQPYSSFPGLNPAVVDLNWSQPNHTPEPAPSFRLEAPGGPSSHSLSSRTRNSQGTNNMR